MAINDLGYREWDLAPTRNRQQWRTIAGFGIRVAWRSTWLKRIFIMAWIPIFIMGAGLFVIEQSIQDIDSDEFPQNVGRFFVAVFPLKSRTRLSKRHNSKVSTRKTNLPHVTNLEAGCDSLPDSSSGWCRRPTRGGRASPRPASGGGRGPCDRRRRSAR